MFKNARDSLSVQILAKQAYPKKPQAFMEAYEHLTRLPFSYMVNRKAVKISFKNGLLKTKEFQMSFFISSLTLLLTWTNGCAGVEKYFLLINGWSFMFRKI